MREPECCQCVPGRDEVAGVCSKLASIPNAIKILPSIIIVTLHVYSILQNVKPT